MHTPRVTPGDGTISVSHTLHPLVSGFTDAQNYDRGRPVYDPAVAEELVEQLGLAAGAPVLELGAGTGQLSRALLAVGLDLTALEPLPGTRELLAAAIGPERARDGVAEQIPLAQDSVEAVFAADSFHWFDTARAMPEIRRVLQKHGTVAILRTVPLFEERWTEGLGKIMEGIRPEHPGFGQAGPAAALEDDPAFGPVNELSLRMPASLDRDGLLAYMASISWVATMPEERRSELLGAIEALLDEHDVQRSEFELEHRVWWASLL